MTAVMILNLLHVLRMCHAVLPTSRLPASLGG